jgi:hypothetical protein
MKVYQVKYTHLGSVKYCYTINFFDCYPTRQDAIDKINRLTFKKQFYDLLIKYKNNI